MAIAAQQDSAYPVTDLKLWFSRWRIHLILGRRINRVGLSTVSFLANGQTKTRHGLSFGIVFNRDGPIQ